ncbi:MAG: hypothetical protein HXS46_12825 [Theionarchaea archaeon]|nr:MAG: hypothetical protein AYK18_10725 [Theionarchaea archaeon DG-70]MBU7011566.1 hypothetical protein [Theionarchaea archaeon]
MKPVKVSIEKYVKGTLRTPPIPCPICGKKTKAIYKTKCQWCRSEWNEEQLKERERLRIKQIETYRKEGLLD